MEGLPFDIQELIWRKLFDMCLKNINREQHCDFMFQKHCKYSKQLVEAQNEYICLRQRLGCNKRLKYPRTKVQNMEDLERACLLESYYKLRIEPIVKQKETIKRYLDEICFSPY
jgi:hypothetical protein